MVDFQNSLLTVGRHCQCVNLPFGHIGDREGIQRMEWGSCVHRLEAALAAAGRRLRHGFCRIADTAVLREAR